MSETEKVETIYATPSGDTTIVRSDASPDSRIIDRLPPGAILRSSGTDGRYQVVEPLRGSGLSWNQGFMPIDELKVDVDLPWRTEYAVMGALSTGQASSSQLLIDGRARSPNPLGQPGSGRMVGLGASLRRGPYIPVGDAGLKGRLDGELALIAGTNAPSRIDSTEAVMLRLAGGVSGIYRATPTVDVSAGLVIGGGPIRSEIALSGGQKVQGTALYGTAEAFTGIGYGRNRLTDLTLKGRVEVGYRLGREISDFGYDLAGDAPQSASVQTERSGYQLSGIFVRVFIGI